MPAPFPGKWVKITDQKPPWKQSDKAWEWQRVKVLPWYRQLFCRHQVTYFAPPSGRFCEKCGKFICNVYWD
jgi:hypothetical protein